MCVTLPQYPGENLPLSRLILSPLAKQVVIELTCAFTPLSYTLGL